MGQPRVRAALVVVCTLAMVLGSTALAIASAGGFSVRPGEIDQKDPATRAYFKPDLKPGATAIHHVVVTNLGSAPLHLLVDAVDGLTGQTSGAVYANRQDPLVKAGRWLVPATHSLTIAGGAVASVAFSINVPRDATPGDHLAGLAFQNATMNSSSGSFAVKQIVREVVGVLVRVPGPASEHLTVGSLALQSLPGTAFASVIVNLSNVGELLCKPALTVTLRGPDGHARTVTRPLDTILPGDSIAYPFPWPDSLAAGKYVARASTAACGPAASTADVPLALGAPLNGSEPSAHAPSHGLRLPSLSLVLGVLLIIAGIVLGLLIGKRRRHDEEAPEPTQVPRRVPLEAPAPASALRRVRTLEQPPVRLERVERVDRPTETSRPEQQRLWP